MPRFGARRNCACENFVATKSILIAPYFGTKKSRTNTWHGRVFITPKGIWSFETHAMC
jgi:hypothetical protein